jgi:hypothetical protein
MDNAAISLFVIEVTALSVSHHGFPSNPLFAQGLHWVGVTNRGRIGPQNLSLIVPASSTGARAAPFGYTILHASR